MFANLSKWLIHFVGAALVCAQLAYWSIRLMTPPPVPAPAPAAPVSTRDPDPVLVARAFGDVDRAVAAAPSNIQLAGVFAAGRDSAAVFVVDDRPARAVRLGQEVAPGSKLVDVDPKSATLESGGVRRQLRVPNAPLAGAAGPTAAGFERRGNVLTAPSLESANVTRTGPGHGAGLSATPRMEAGELRRGGVPGAPTDK
jgi:general secretion pathway protein C